MTPGSDAAARECLRRALALVNDRRLVEAAALLREAEDAGADVDACAGARWFLAMLGGEFEAAWCASDAIRARGVADAHRFWNGESLRGRRVMVRCLHGYGDAVQMLRLLPRLREMAAYVIVQAAPALVPLVRCLPGADEVVTWAEEGAPEPVWEVQVEVMELPYVLRLQHGQLPFATRYLRLPAEACEEARRSIEGSGTLSGGVRGRVGMVWAAGGWNPSRSIPVTDLAEFLEEAGYEFWSLQGPGASDEADALFARGVLLDGSALTDGVVALAATIAAMDLVITVDTLAAHVAGALGVPVWVMLEERADWRWMHGREDSPWYPTMRLFRCEADEGWPALLARVGQALAAARANGALTRA